MVQAIVFLPLLAAIVAGLGNRMIGNLAAKLVTTGALFAAHVPVLADLPRLPRRHRDVAALSGR